MTNPLWLRAIPMPLETPISNASRNAVLNHQEGIFPFCQDTGLDFQGLVDGDGTAVEKLARLVGVSPDAYASGTIRRNGQEFNIGGERLVDSALRRTRLHICPACLKDDLSCSDLPPPAAAFGRVEWLLTSIRTCTIHDIALVELPRPAKAKVHDFAAFAGPALSDLDRLLSDATRRPASALERYVSQRLQGSLAETPFLNSLELHAAARFCEVLGAVEQFGANAKLGSLSEDSLYLAGDVGYSYASRDETGIREVFTTLHSRFLSSHRGSEGPNAFFGSFYHWLSGGGKHPAYTPIRDLLRNHIVETIPVGTGQVILGTAVTQRRLHSVWTASRETGIHPKRLRKILTAEGVIKKEHARVKNGFTVFEVEAASKVLDTVLDAIPLIAVESYLGSGRIHTALLYEHGFIQPCLSSSKVYSIRQNLFARTELNAFLATLFRDATDLAEADVSLADLPGAAKRARCSAMEIVQFILDRKLKRVVRDPAKTGYMSLLVEVDEVRTLLACKPLDDLPFFRVRDMLRTSDQVIRALVDNGVLKTRAVVNPLNRCPALFIIRQSADEFAKTYCSISEMAREAGVHFRKVAQTLRTRGILPVLDRELYHASFFLRSDIVGLTFE
ncbi:TniQ family protein [Microvirga yunnanensis]|uniref:TniQ family protein n=1 Tax=Microvirga yunnanensis TaxID=2953740 RepID=UPI0021C78DCC|nr:TniQ family protein [Microvirga sp. HBU65207]